MNVNEGNPISLIEIAALLGALAWLPHIFSFIKNFFIKPQVRIILHKYAELGFTTFGNILNFKIAFSVKNKDTVISGISLKIVHESGDEKILSWQGIVHRLFEMKREGSSFPMEREHAVLAIKLNQKDIEERVIRFQEEEYLLKKDEHEKVVLKKSANLKKNKILNFENIIKLDEYQEMLTYQKQSFNWKPGKYEISFLLESPENITVFDNRYKFELNTLNVESLENNKPLIEKSYEEIITNLTDPKKDNLEEKDDKTDEKVEVLSWNWVNPLLKKSI